jgi:addiction module HigA family antidote
MTNTAARPGDLLRAELAARGMTQSKLAEVVGRPVQVINDVVTGKKSITAYTALDLEKALGIEATYWLHAQANYDLAQARARLAAGHGRPGLRPRTR